MHLAVLKGTCIVTLLKFKMTNVIPYYLFKTTLPQVHVKCAI